MNTESNPNQPYDRDELAALINALCDDRIDDQQAARLNTILDSSEEAMEFYVNSMWVNTSVERHFGSGSSNIDPTLISGSNVFDQANNESSNTTETESKSGAEAMSNSATTIQASANPAKPMNGSMLLAVAAAIALIVGLAFVLSSDHGGTEIGNGSQIAQHATGEKADSESDGNASGSLNSHSPQVSNLEESEDDQLAEQATEFGGADRTVLSDGTIVIAKAGTQYSVKQERRLRLEQGELYLIVAKSKTPFVVETADGEVRATGTRFLVSASEN